MTLSTGETTLQSLKQILDASQIITAETRSPKLTSKLQVAFTQDAELPPIVYPNSVEELRSLMTWASQDKKSVLVCGNASKLSWGNPIPKTDVVLSIRNLNRVIDHAAGDLTLTVETGVSLQSLRSHLQSTGQMLPIDPAYADQATIGGILATRDAGSLRHRFGGARDLCLGLSFVRADGQLAKGGGRVVKNVAGYDLMKLFTGSFGTLGIITEVTLRLYPIQESSQTVIVSGSTEAIASLIAEVLDSTLTPVSVDVLSKTLLHAIKFEGELGLAVRFQSLPESVLAQVHRLKDLAKTLSVQLYESDTAVWQDLHQSLWRQTDTPTVIAKVGLLPHAIPSTIQTFQVWCDQQAVNLQAQILAGWGIGTLQLTGSGAALPEIISKMRQHCEQHQGYLSLLEAPMDLRQKQDVWGYPGNAIAPMRKLKDTFDPHHLLNPGRFVGGI